VLSFSFDKGLLAPLVYHHLVNNGLIKVSPDFHQLLLLGHVTYWLLVCPFMQPQVLYSTVAVLRCGPIGGHNSSEIKWSRVFLESRNTRLHFISVRQSAGEASGVNRRQRTKTSRLICRHFNAHICSSANFWLRNFLSINFFSSQRIFFETRLNRDSLTSLFLTQKLDCWMCTVDRYNAGTLAC